MRYWAIALAGLVLCGASIVALDWGIYHLIRTGTCASGGPYVSARPCPPGTGLHILAVIGSVFGGLIGVAIFAARGRADTRRPSPYPLGLAMWTLLFCTIALSSLYAVLGPAAGPDAPKGTAIFVAALFIPMGLAPAPFGMLGRRRTERAADPAAVRADPAADPANAPAGDGDPIAQIERLGELRDRGLITEAEFQVQKQRLLGKL